MPRLPLTEKIIGGILPMPTVAQPPQPPPAAPTSKALFFAPIVCLALSLLAFIPIV